MTRKPGLTLKLAFCAILVLSPALATAQTFLQLATGGTQPNIGLAMSPDDTRAVVPDPGSVQEQSSVALECDAIVVYEEDENGNPVNGTISSGCAD